MIFLCHIRVAMAVQIDQYVVKPEQLRQEASRNQNRKTSVFLSNFYQNVPLHQGIVDFQKVVTPG